MTLAKRLGLVEHDDETSTREWWERQCAEKGILLDECRTANIDLANLNADLRNEVSRLREAVKAGASPSRAQRDLVLELIDTVADECGAGIAPANATAMIDEFLAKWIEAARS